MLFFFPRGVLDEILNLIESVSEGFPSYFSYSQPQTNGQSDYPRTPLDTPGHSVTALFGIRVNSACGQLGRANSALVSSASTVCRVSHPVIGGYQLSVQPEIAEFLGCSLLYFRCFRCKHGQELPAVIQTPETI